LVCTGCYRRCFPRPYGGRAGSGSRTRRCQSLCRFLLLLLNVLLLPTLLVLLLLLGQRAFATCAHLSGGLLLLVLL
jgi:hypothetical protein